MKRRWAMACLFARCQESEGFIIKSVGGISGRSYGNVHRQTMWSTPPFSDNALPWNDEQQQSDVILELLKEAHKQERLLAVLAVEEKYQRELESLRMDLREILKEQQDMQQRRSGSDVNEEIESLKRITEADKKASIDQLMQQHQREVAALQSEIQGLRDNLRATQTLRGEASANLPAPTAEVEELRTKVQAYQRMLTDLIVRAQTDRQQAVQDAENRMRTKYERILDDWRRASGGSSGN